MITKYVKRLTLALCIAMGQSFKDLDPSILNSEIVDDTQFSKLTPKQKFGRLMKLKMKKGRAAAQKGPFSLLVEDTYLRVKKIKVDENDTIVEEEDLEATYKDIIKNLEGSTYIKNLEQIIDKYLQQQQTTWRFEQNGKFYVITNENDDFQITLEKSFDKLKPLLQVWSTYTPDPSDQEADKFLYKIIRALIKPQQKLETGGIAHKIIAKLKDGKMVRFSVQNGAITESEDVSALYKKRIEAYGETRSMLNVQDIVDRCIETKNPVFSAASYARHYQIFHDDEGKFAIYDALPEFGEKLLAGFKCFALNASLGGKVEDLQDLGESFAQLMQQNFSELTESKNLFLAFFIEQKKSKVALLASQEKQIFFVGEKDGKLALSSMEDSFKLVNQKLGPIFQQLDTETKLGTFNHNGQTWTIIHSNHSGYDIIQGPPLEVYHCVQISDLVDLDNARRLNTIKGALESMKKATDAPKKISTLEHGIFFATAKPKSGLILIKKDEMGVFCIDLHEQEVTLLKCLKLFKDLEQLPEQDYSTKLASKIYQILKASKRHDDHIEIAHLYENEHWHLLKSSKRDGEKIDIDDETETSTIAPEEEDRLSEIGSVDDHVDWEARSNMVAGQTFDELQKTWNHWTISTKEPDLYFFYQLKKGKLATKGQTGDFKVVAENQQGRFEEIEFKNGIALLPKDIDKPDRLYDIQIEGTKLDISNLRQQIDTCIKNRVNKFQANGKSYAFSINTNSKNKFLILETPVDPDAYDQHDYKWVEIEGENILEAFVKLLREPKTKPLDLMQTSKIVLAYSILSPENVVRLRKTNQEGSDCIFYVQEFGNRFMDENMVNSKRQVDEAFKRQELFDNKKKLGTFESKGKNYTVYEEDGKRKIVEAPSSQLLHVEPVKPFDPEHVLRKIVEAAQTTKRKPSALKAVPNGTFVVIDDKETLLLIKKDQTGAFCIDSTGKIIERDACVKGIQQVRTKSGEAEKLLERRDELKSQLSLPYTGRVLGKLVFDFEKSVANAQKRILDEKIAEKDKEISELLKF